MSHRPRKRFGQNFLISEAVIGRMVQAIRPLAGDYMVEIGPGHGALTRPLLRELGQLQVIEIDRDLAAGLRNWQAAGLQVHEWDALRVDFAATFPAVKALRVVGNLPYNISTPLLFHLLAQQVVLTDMHFLLQREVVERMAAGPGSGTYGRLSVMLQYRCRVEPLFLVPAGAFQPRPQVESQFVRLVPRPPPVLAKDPRLLEIMVRAAFGKRRKTLRNCLRGLAVDGDFETVGVRPDLRPEEVGVETWVALANAVSAPGESC